MFAGFSLAALAAPRAPAAADRTILVLGDSLSAAYGLAVEEGWVALLQKRLRDRGYGYRVVNASVSGETTSGGRARVARALALHKPAIVIVELGANDGLRGLPLDSSRANLDAIARASTKVGAKLLILGMQMPPNYGQRYANEFAQLFAELARQHTAALVPFFLAGVATQPALFQPDGLHPTAKAQPIMLNTVWTQLAPVLDKN